MKTFKLDNWLPTTKKEVEARGWDYLDVILFSGDAYVDLVNMKEFFFFYYPASPYDTQDEETFTARLFRLKVNPSLMVSAIS